MEWFKVYSRGILRGSLSQTTDITQLTWLKMLALENETKFRNGRLEFAPGKPYSLEYIAVNCGITEGILEGVLEEFKEDVNPEDGTPRITIEFDGTIVLNNWEKYQVKRVVEQEGKPPLSEEAKDKMNVQRQVKNPNLTINGATLQGKAVLDKATAEIQEDQEVLNKQAEVKANKEAIANLKDKAKNKKEDK